MYFMRSGAARRVELMRVTTLSPDIDEFEN